MFNFIGDDDERHMWLDVIENTELMVSSMKESFEYRFHNTVDKECQQTGVGVSSYTELIKYVKANLHNKVSIKDEQIVITYPSGIIISITKELDVYIETCDECVDDKKLLMSKRTFKQIQKFIESLI